jgi:hypothetical protein
LARINGLAVVWRSGYFPYYGCKCIGVTDNNKLVDTSRNGDAQPLLVLDKSD